MSDVKLTEQEARSRSYPVQENMPVQQRLWLFERLGLWWMLLMVLLTLAGLFSKGVEQPPNQQRAGAPERRVRGLPA